MNTRMSQHRLFPNLFASRRGNGTSTFIDNLKLPIHRWFRFSAGFSAVWVKNVINSEINQKGSNLILLDPFAGSGTSLICADECGIQSFGIEAQPFIARIAQIKTHWECDIRKFEAIAEKILDEAITYDKVIDEYPKLIYNCFDANSLIKLEGIKKAWQEFNDGTLEYEYAWLCITSILRQVSTVGTAQWQYILPRKTKKNPLDVFDAFKKQYRDIIIDVSLFSKTTININY